MGDECDETFKFYGSVDLYRPKVWSVDVLWRTINRKLSSGTEEDGIMMMRIVDVCIKSIAYIFIAV